MAGELSLDYVKVRCVADIELPSLQGQGRLEMLDVESDRGAGEEARSQPA